MTRRKPPDRGDPPTDKREHRTFYQKLRRFYAGIHIEYHTVSSHPDNSHAGAPVKEPELADRARELHEDGYSAGEIAVKLGGENDYIDPHQVRRWLHNK